MWGEDRVKIEAAKLKNIYTALYTYPYIQLFCIYNIMVTTDQKTYNTDKKEEEIET